MTTIKLTEEENVILNSIEPFDNKNNWKYMKPYFYKDQKGYYTIYTREELPKEIRIQLK